MVTVIRSTTCPHCGYEAARLEDTSPFYDYSIYCYRCGYNEWVDKDDTGKLATHRKGGNSARFINSTKTYGNEITELLQKPTEEFVGTVLLNKDKWGICDATFTFYKDNVWYTSDILNGVTTTFEAYELVKKL